MDNDKNKMALAMADNLDDIVESMKEFAKQVDRGPGGREIALAITNAEQSIMWLEAAQRQD